MSFLKEFSVTSLELLSPPPSPNPLSPKEISTFEEYAVDQISFKQLPICSDM